MPPFGDDPWTALTGFRTNALPDTRVAVRIAGQIEFVEPAAGGTIAIVGGDQILFHDGEAWIIAAPTADRTAASPLASGSILAPMPGRILFVETAAGETVKRGQRLIVVEAMKMEHALVAPFDGVVTQLLVLEGQQVGEQAMLALIEAA